MFWTDDRLRRLGISVLVSLFIACAIAAFGDSSARSLLYRGNFPAFYTAAHLAREGRLGEIYNDEIQAELQQTFWPSLEESYYAFSYPPYVAQGLAPLSRLEPQQAKLLFSGAMAFCLIAALALAGAAIPELRSNPLAVFAGALAFAPLFIGLLGGQNTALSLLCLSVACWGVSRGKPGAQFLAGLALGIWLFKPHFALLMLSGCALFAPRPLLFGAMLPAFGYYLLAATSLGPLWPQWWAESAWRFAGEDSAANRFQMISLWSLASALPDALGGNALVARLSQLGVLALGGWILWRSTTLSLKARIAGPHAHLEALLLLAPAALLLSPHALFYELAWLIPSFAYFSRGTRDARVWLTIALVTLSAMLALGRELFVIQPLLFLPLGIFFLGSQKIGFKRLEAV